MNSLVAHRAGRVLVGNLWAVAASLSLVFFVTMLFMGTPAKAQSAEDVCRATLVIDRSGSVARDDLTALIEHVEDLFWAGGIDDPRYQLAFWSFSSAAGSARSGNYNAPYHGFINTKGALEPRLNGPGGFMEKLRSINPSGATNYEQGLAYDRGQQNSTPEIRSIANDTDVFLFLTDGVPNTPGNGDNNSVARQAAYDTAAKYGAAKPGIRIVGGLIGAGLDPGSLNYMVSAPNVAGSVISVAGYGAELKNALMQIKAKCDEGNPPNPSAVYGLEPIVTTDSRIVAGSGNVTFNYSVNNTSGEHASRPSSWTVKRLLVGREQSVVPVTSAFANDAGRPYRDGYSCERLMLLISNNGSCTDATDGQRVFAPGSNDMSFDVGGVREAVIDDSWEAGTKLCYVLTITVPTNMNNPRDRYSRAACTTIGKLPSVQVHGGDIWVGRKMAGDTREVEGETLPPVNIRTSVATKSDGSSYGSWAEYGVFAAGTITGFASKSGLADPVLGLSDWNKLTFANTDSELGKYVEPDSVQNTMPNVATAILDRFEDSTDISAIEELDVGSLSSSGLYKKPSGGVVLSASEISKGRSIVVHVPEGKVTIVGDIRYDNGDDEPYTSITQIPQLVIIAQSIDIQADVTQVDAWLIANGDETGVIRTCDTPGPLTSQICQRPLQINGPVMARELQLRRTAGAGIGGAAADPAEIINLRADVYLWSQSEGRSGARAQTTHTIEMPPYF